MFHNIATSHSIRRPAICLRRSPEDCHQVKCYKTFYICNLQMFVISYSVWYDRSFQPNLMLASKAEAYKSEASFRCSILVYAPGLLTKIRIGWKGSPCTNSLAYYKHLSITSLKSFITFDPEFSLQGLGLNERPVIDSKFWMFKQTFFVHVSLEKRLLSSAQCFAATFKK